LHQSRAPFVDSGRTTGDELLELFKSAPWKSAGACRDHPELNWFPERGEPIRAQRAVCAACPVRAECLDAAIDGHEYGVWAGTSGRERRVIRRTAA